MPCYTTVMISVFFVPPHIAFHSYQPSSFSQKKKKKVMYSSLPVLKSQCDEKDARPAPSRLGSPPTIPALSSMRAKAV